MNDFEINGERLQLRKINMLHIPSLLKHANSPRIAANVWNITYPYSESDATMRVAYIQQGFQGKKWFIFSIILMETGELIGEVSLQFQINPAIAQVGYWVGQHYWGRVIATEATKMILKYGFQQLGLAMIFAETHMDNEASSKVLSKSGMKFRQLSYNIERWELTKDQFTRETADEASS